MPPPQISAAQLQRIIDNKTKPIGSLGQLESLALQIAKLQQSTSPVANTCELIIFIADHGIVEDGVSAFPQSVTQQMAQNFLAGGAAANVFADSNGIQVTLVDAGMVNPVPHKNLVDARIGAGTNNFRLMPAMTAAQRDQAIACGQAMAQSRSCDALCFGEMGIGNTSAATMLLHKVLQIPLDRLVGRGTGVDDEGLARKHTLLTQAAERTTTPLPTADALMHYGGFEIATMTGAMLGAAQTKKVILVDGFIATAAAVMAMHLEPKCKEALVFSHCSAETGHKIVLDHIQFEPLLDLGLRLGEGTGAVLAWPLVRSAVAMFNNMASFESAAVDGPIDA